MYTFVLTCAHVYVFAFVTFCLCICLWMHFVCVYICTCVSIGCVGVCGRRVSLHNSVTYFVTTSELDSFFSSRDALPISIVFWHRENLKTALMCIHMHMHIFVLTETYICVCPCVSIGCVGVYWRRVSLHNSVTYFVTVSGLDSFFSSRGALPRSQQEMRTAVRLDIVSST